MCRTGRRETCLIWYSAPFTRTTILSTLDAVSRGRVSLAWVNGRRPVKRCGPGLPPAGRTHGVFAEDANVDGRDDVGGGSAGGVTRGGAGQGEGACCHHPCDRQREHFVQRARRCAGERDRCLLRRRLPGRLVVGAVAA